MRYTSAASAAPPKDTPSSSAKEGTLRSMSLAPVPAPMVVAACAAAGALRPESRRRPRPGPGEILLRLRTGGVCGTDLWKLRHGAAAAGSVLGHEVVGSVAELGAGVAGLRPGDRLFVPHHVACGRCEFCRA